MKKIVNSGFFVFISLCLLILFNIFLRDKQESQSKKRNLANEELNSQEKEDSSERNQYAVRKIFMENFSQSSLCAKAFSPNNNLGHNLHTGIDMQKESGIKESEFNDSVDKDKGIDKKYNSLQREDLKPADSFEEEDLDGSDMIFYNNGTIEG